MTIQEFAQIIADVARVEDAKVALKLAEEACYDASIHQEKSYLNNDKAAQMFANEEWLKAYGSKKKAVRKLDRELKKFLDKYMTDEYSDLTVEARSSNVKSDREKFWYIRYRVLRQSQNVIYETK